MEHLYIAPEETPLTFIHYNSLDKNVEVIFTRPADGKKYSLTTPAEAFSQVNMLLKNNIKYVIFYRDGQPCGLSLNRGYCYYHCSQQKLDSHYMEVPALPALLEHFVAFGKDKTLRKDARAALKILSTVSLHPHDVRNFADKVELQQRYKIFCGDELVYRVALALAEDLADNISLSKPTPDELRHSRLMKLFTSDGLDDYINALV